MSLPISQTSERAMELLKDLAIEQGIDWIKARKITALDVDKLQDLAIAHGIYIFFAEDYVMAKFSSYKEYGLIADVLIAAVSKSALLYVTKLVLGKPVPAIKDLIISASISESVGLAYEFIMTK